MRRRSWSIALRYRPLRDLAKVLLGALHQVARINPTGGNEQRIVRCVPGVIEVADVLHRNPVGFLRIAHDRMTVWCRGPQSRRSEEHTSELQSLMRISYAVFCLKK